MLQGLTLVLLAASFGFLLWVKLENRRLTRISLALQARIDELQNAHAHLAMPPHVQLTNSPLEGLRIGIHIGQDHNRPTFATLLLERLQAEDADAFLLTEDEATELIANWSGDAPDIAVWGRLLCNGYSDVYYEADITCRSAGGVILSLTEAPAEAGRQASLAVTLVSRLAQQVARTADREERQRALREIRE